MPAFDEGTRGLNAILVSSDRARRSTLYEIGTDQIVQLYRNVAQCIVLEVVMTRGPDGQWEVQAS